MGRGQPSQAAGDAASLRAEERRAALDRYAILDTPPEGVFDDLAAVAAELTGFDGAAITFIDAEREWVKAAYGVELGAAPLTGSLGARAIEAPGAPLIVPDIDGDERLAASAWAADAPGVRAYAALPLTTPGGLAIGTLCVVALEPREIEPRVVPALERVARLVLSRLEHRREDTLAHDLIAVIGFDGSFIRVNGAARTILGYEPSEMIGRRARDFIHPDDLDRSQLALRDGVAGSTQGQFENRYRRKDGEYRWLSWSGQIVPEEKVFYSYARDVTERRHGELLLREAEGRFRNAFESAPIGMVLFDSERRIQRVNRELCRMVGYRPEEILGRSGEAFTHPDDIERTEAHVGLVESGERRTTQLEKRYLHRDGHEVWAETTVTMMSDTQGEGAGLLAQVQDITARKRAEQQSREARLSAERANLAKSEFLSRMSHELRTPLNAVLGFAQLLELEELDPGQRESVARILAGGHHLLGLIDDVLDISRIEAGQLPIFLSPVAIDRVVEAAADLLSPLARDRGIEVSLKLPEALPLDVEGDSQRLEQVLLNLLSNAIKYGPKGSRVCVTVEAVEDCARVTVSDQGPGIPAEQRERLFMPFERLAAAATGIEGTGLGLALSRNLIEAMNGVIGVDDADGGGSAFWFELPLAAEESPREQPTGAGAERPAVGKSNGGWACRLLYAEDNASDVQLVERLLRRFGDCRIEAAGTGAEAIELARTGVHDVVLLDLDLPDMHGSEVLEQLRAEPRTAAIPVIVISATAGPADVERVLAQGASAYEPKPIDVQRFLRALNRALATAA